MKRRGATRRAVLGGVAGLGLGSLAGCSGLFERQSVGEPDVLAERPNAVYVPTHVEGMEMIGMSAAADVRIAAMYSYAHRFWTMEVGGTKRVSPSDDDAHLMVSVWDPATGQVLPVRSGLTVTVTKDGEEFVDRTPWTMLSQTMGFHYGDNVSLGGDGTYTLTVEMDGLSIDRRGSFADQFEEPVSAEFDWEYSRTTRDEISFRRLDDAGERGAVEPMEMAMPLSIAPTEEELPGQVLGTGTSGDARFVVTVTDQAEGSYLAVSPRTPYNRYVLPLLSLSATVTRSGERVFDGPLRATLGPQRGSHYGATVDGLESGDEVVITVDSPPQLSRHEGYETAFRSMDDVTVTVE